MIPSLDDLRKRVKELRVAAGLTQVEAAETADVSQSFVAKLESGEAVPNYADAATLYNALEELEQEIGKVAGEVMSSRVVSLDPSDSVSDASSLMTAEGFSQVPVLEDGDSVGSVTSRDLLGAEASDQVRDYMGPAFPTVPAATGMDAVAGLLRSANAVLVRNSEGIDGIITAADVI